MNLNLKVLGVLMVLALAVSCKPNKRIYEMQCRHEAQIDSLMLCIDSLESEIDGLTVANAKQAETIKTKDSLILSYKVKADEYKDVIKEYKTVLYAIVGDDGLYHYGEIDYD